MKIEQSTNSGKVYEVDVGGNFADELKNYITSFK